MLKYVHVFNAITKIKYQLTEHVEILLKMPVYVALDNGL